ncbi:Chromosome transmission fidelity protein 18 [Penicillium canariense]|uniref:Chromosome transmission fidelity protein 18 n=1 Tax=Penicillium canariense TaxID=189055 RepID=A0A9W9LV47_9EURO|nr:Chromosome transmission fidelity protein 18 [Penicillium canariense]KAJ5176552.1 Chromosome transmission fidelity protein 18 [Penicillium canariense]
MIPSSPNFLSSFDPALHLHSEDPTNATSLPSESFDDDLEAIHLHRLEQTRNKVVIQHRAWNLSDVFRSDDDIRPDTPTKDSIKTPRRTAPTRAQNLSFLPSSPPTLNMPFITPSGPAVLGNSDGNAQKRKATDREENSPPAEPKRPKFLGGFVDDDDDDDDEISELRDAQLKSQFELQETTDLPGILEEPQTSAYSVQPNDETPRISRIQAEIASRPVPTSSTKIQIKTCNGKTHHVTLRKAQAPISFERMIAGRSETDPGRAQRSYYGIEIHKLLDEAAKEAKAAQAAPRAPVQESVERTEADAKQRKADSMMWTEKYRARKFTDLIGDERTHRAVLRWLKGWEPIVFPGLAKSSRLNKIGQEKEDEERMHRKVLLLSGPPGLGKTTLAHVCAKQAGYEVLEINASDERSKDVVKGRIRDALGTENIKGANVEVGENKVRRAAKPVCVVVDEVDGVVGGAGSGGEGGFMKALVDLVLLDQRNARYSAENGGKPAKNRKGDTFRFLRPLILVCNDLYHPSLRPLRASSLAEMIHVRQAPLENVVQRVKNIFSREGIPCDGDGARRLCEAAWGLESRRKRGSKHNGSAEGDIRSVLVAAEWVAHKLRNECSSPLRLTRNWLESRVLSASTEGGSFFKEMSRGGVREIVNRVFTEAAGFTDAPTGLTFQGKYDGPNSRVPVGVADLRKRHAINRLREMVDASGEHDRCVTDCFASYPIQQYQDDNFLSKPTAAYDWLHFHDSISSRVHSSQEWELGPYLSQSTLAFHHLFASAAGRMEANDRDKDEKIEEEHPFLGPRADFLAYEAQKENRSILNGFHSSLSAPMTRMFRSTDSVVTDLIPHLVRMLSPDVKPVIVRGGGEQRSTASVRKESERTLVQSAVRVMSGMGVTFEKVRVEHEGGSHGGWAYRMEPSIDSLVTFSKITGSSSASGTAPVRYAVRQVLDQEYRKLTMRKQSDAMSAASGKSLLGKSAHVQGDAAQNAVRDGAKRDFFGRVIQEPVRETNDTEDSNPSDESSKAGRKVWVTFHEGFSNAVRKPISLGELMAGL